MGALESIKSTTQGLTLALEARELVTGHPQQDANLPGTEAHATYHSQSSKMASNDPCLVQFTSLCSFHLCCPWLVTATNEIQQK